MGAWCAVPAGGADRKRWSTVDPFHGEDSPGIFFYENARNQLLVYADIRSYERVLDLGGEAQVYLSRLAAVLSAVPSPLAYTVAYVMAER